MKTNLEQGAIRSQQQNKSNQIQADDSNFSAQNSEINLSKNKNQGNGERETNTNTKLKLEQIKSQQEDQLSQNIKQGAQKRRLSEAGESIGDNEIPKVLQEGLQSNHQSQQQRSIRNQENPHQQLNVNGINSQQEQNNQRQVEAHQNSQLEESSHSSVGINEENKGWQDCVLWIIVGSLGIALIFVFYGFIKSLIEQAKDIEEPHYEVLSFSQNGTGIQIIAQCKRCPLFFGDASNKIAEKIELSVDYLSSRELSIIIQSQNSTNWRMPSVSPFPFHNRTSQIDKVERNDLLMKLNKTLIKKQLPFSHLKNKKHKHENELKLKEEQFQRKEFGREFIVQIRQKPLEIKISRLQSEQQIFKLTSTQLIYSTLYKEFTFRVASEHAYGIGERGSFHLNPADNITLWTRRSNFPNKTSSSSTQDSTDTNFSQYKPQNSYHPAVLVKEDSNNFNIIYLRSSSVLEANFVENNYLTFKLVTGIIELVFFIGDQSAQSTIRDFHTYLGGYLTPPLWSLGTHYKLINLQNLSQIQAAKKLFSDNKIRLDALWLDSSIYKDNKSFRIDKEKFNLTELKSMTEKIKIIPEIQPGIKIDQDSLAYTVGIQRDVFIKSVKDSKKQIVFGKNANQQSVHYPDYFHPAAQDYTNDIYGHLQQDLAFKGWVFIDNEITDYSTPSPPAPSPPTPSPTSPPPQKSLFKQITYHSNIDQVNSTTTPPSLPYIPGNISLSNHSIDPQAVHEGDILELEAHNLYSIMQANSGFTFMTKQLNEKMPFIVSRSTSSGFGALGGHLAELADCSWNSLKQSISLMFSFNIFGIPQVGFVICPKKQSFQGVDEELIARWMQLSAFYSFFVIQTDADRPSEFLRDPRFLKYYKNGIAVRSLIQKYLYTIYFEQQGKGAIIQPLFFEFPDDDLLFANPSFIKDQFLVGSALMVTPILEPTITTIYPYFPKDAWFDFYTGNEVRKASDPSSASEVNCKLDGEVPIFVRGGRIIPVQVQQIDSWSIPIQEQRTDYDIIVAFGEGQEGLYAEGKILGKAIFTDAGIYDSCINENCLFKVNASAQILQSNTPDKLLYQLVISFDTVVPFIQVDTISIQHIILFLEGKKVSYFANVNLSGKQQVSFQIVL